MSDSPEVRGAHLPGGIAEARAALIAWIEEAGASGRRFLEVHLTRVAPGVYRARHSSDAGLPAASLTRHEDPFDARAIAQVTADGEHRPLKTAPNLRRGWSFEALDAAGLWTALDYLYPACAAHWFAGTRGTLRVTHWRETAARQSGMYSAVGLLSERAVRDTVRACCGDAVCLRQVAWRLGEENPTPLPTNPEETAARSEMSDAVVPCPEACSMFISLSRKVLSVERSEPLEIPGLGTLRAGEVEQIREIVAAAAEGTLAAVRDGDFDEPTNRRRVRYLAAKLQL
ncbi:MAG: hypothetical protein KY464_11815 [Gemmatimonadetes bacterium]|nr:hypothetical protein [Gemmatimonadota bacterium]